MNTIATTSYANWLIEANVTTECLTSCDLLCPPSLLKYISRLDWWSYKRCSACRLHSATCHTGNNDHSHRLRETTSDMTHSLHTAGEEGEGGREGGEGGGGGGGEKRLCCRISLTHSII